MSDNLNTKFGVLKYSSINIGDEIQSIAAMRFLPFTGKDQNTVQQKVHEKESHCIL